MALSIWLSWRAARFRSTVGVSVLLSASACNGDRLGPLNTEEPPIATPAGQIDPGTNANISFAGGIPIGTFAQPTSVFGLLYNGAKLTLKPWELLDTLRLVKARGGRVTLMLAGNDVYYKDASGHFDLGKWKARVARFRTRDFSSYLRDGTIIGHYLLDEPNDPNNWNGRPVPPSMVEELAKYSKQIWPTLPTIVRTESSYLAKWSGSYLHLDAAWAQYVHRKGDVDAFISRNISDAKRKGLALVVGLNILRGGPDQSPMTGGQVESWETALLKSSYPCAFISWEHDASYLSTASMNKAMAVLRTKAQNRSSRSCQGV